MTLVEYDKITKVWYDQDSRRWKLVKKKLLKQILFRIEKKKNVKEKNESLYFSFKDFLENLKDFDSKFDCSSKNLAKRNDIDDLKNSQNERSLLDDSLWNII